MDFTAYDTVREDGDLMFTGQIDKSGKITSITPQNSVATMLLGRHERRNGKITTSEEFSAAFPRFQIGWDDEGNTEEGEEVGAGDIVKLDKAKQQVFGWAYVSHDNNGDVVVDRSAEFIADPEVLEKSAYDYVIKSRKGGTDHKRDGDSVVHNSTMIESMVFTPEKIESMGIPSGTIPQGAWWVGFQIHDADTWDRFERGELTQFSIHGRGIKKRVEGAE